MGSKLINGDSVDELKKLKDNSVDLLCTDPPYGYSFMGKEWDKTLPPKEIFEESLRVLKPGGFAFVMSAPRSDVQYRMMQMLDDVGFQIGFTPIYWTYATGFPKAMNIGKAVDKRLGAKREVTGKGKAGAGMNKKKGFGVNTTQGGEPTTEWDETDTPASDDAKKLNGSYASYQPKPAVEVVIVAMKPLEQKGYIDQALNNGKGVTWLDDCRIPFAGMDDTEQYESDRKGFTERSSIEEGEVYSEAYDNPSQQWGFKKPTKKVRTTKRKPREEDTVFKTSGFKSEDNDTAEASPLGRFAANLLVSDDVLDNDNAFSRYYSLDAWWESRLAKLPEEIQRTFPFLVVPKASKREKNNGLENNNHPTVKPLTLMSYLVILGSRKDDVVLDPFMGSGTTPMACVTLDRNYIGIEREDEYFKIAKARVAKLEKPAHQWDKFL